jgi:AraC-like DNA-binding protein
MGTVPAMPHPLPAESGRETYEDDRCLIPELRLVGWTSFARAQVLGLVPHRHPDAFEICYLERGEVEWWVGDEVHDVRRGDVFITHPDEEHGGVDTVMQPCALHWLQVSFPRRGCLPGLDVAQTRSLSQAMAGLRPRCFPGDAVLGTLCHRLLMEHRQPGPFAEVAARALLHEFLIALLRVHGHHGDLHRDPARSVPIRRSLAWIEEHLAEEPAVSAIAHAVGLSPSRFHERFLAETGFSPAAYVTRRRIYHAKRHLAESGRTMTDIALGLGFPSSQYFATVFKRHTGLSPGAYRTAQTD